MVPKRPRREDQLVPRLQPSMSMVPHVQGIDLMPAIRGVHEHMSTWMSSLINAQDGCLQAVAQRASMGRSHQEHLAHQVALRTTMPSRTNEVAWLRAQLSLRDAQIEQVKAQRDGHFMQEEELLAHMRLLSSEAKDWKSRVVTEAEEVLCRESAQMAQHATEAQEAMDQHFKAKWQKAEADLQALCQSNSAQVQSFASKMHETNVEHQKLHDTQERRIQLEAQALREAHLQEQEAAHTAQEYQRMVQELRQYADEQPDKEKILWKRHLSQQADYRAEIHELHTELLNMREKTEMKAHLSANMCRIEQTAPSRTVDAEPENTLNTLSPGKSSRWILPHELETPHRPTSSGLQTPVGFPVQYAPSPMTQEYSATPPAHVPPAQWGELYGRGSDEGCELFGTALDAEDPDELCQQMAAPDQEELQQAHSPIAPLPPVPVVAARCVNGTLIRPNNAEDEQPSTALQQSEVRAPGGVQLGRGVPGQSPGPGGRRGRDISTPLPPPPPPPPVPHAAAAPGADSYPVQWTPLHTKPKAAGGGGPSGDPPNPGGGSSTQWSCPSSHPSGGGSGSGGGTGSGGANPPPPPPPPGGSPGGGSGSSPMPKGTPPQQTGGGSGAPGSTPPTPPGIVQPPRSSDPWAPLDRSRKALPKLMLPSNYKACSILEMRQLLESWYDRCTFAIATWRGDAQKYWLDEILDHARARHDQWLQSTPSQRASLEPAYILGDRKHIPQASNAVESVLRTELLDAIPRSIADACMRHGYCTAELIAWYVMKQLILPQDINEVTMQRELLTPPKVTPSTLDQGCVWLEEMQHRLNLCMKTGQHVHPRTIITFVQEVLSGITQYYRTVGNIWDSLYLKHQLRESSLTLDRVYAMLAEFLIELRLHEEQDKITQIVNGSSTSVKHSMYDEYVSASKGKVPAKGKGKQKSGKGSQSQWRPPCDDYWKPHGCSQGHHCPKYHPRRQPGRCAICGSTRHPTSQCTRPVKPKAKQAEWDETVGDWAETEWQDDQGEIEEYEAQKGKKGKGKGSKPKGKSKGKTTPKSIAPRPTQSSPTKNDRSQPKTKPEARACMTNDFLFAMMNTKSKMTWRHSTWNDADYMICTVAEPQKKLPVFRPGKWSLSTTRPIFLYGHDAKTMKNFTLFFDSSDPCDSLDKSWFGEMWFPVEKSMCQAHTALSQATVPDQADLDMDSGCEEPDLCFSRSQVRDPAYALLDSGATHVLLPGHMLPKGARSFEVTVNLAVGKEKAKCWRNEVYAQERAHPLLPLGRLTNLLDTKFVWENGTAVMQCKDKGKWRTMTQFEIRNNMAYASQMQFEVLRRALWVQQAHPDTVFNWQFWERAAQDPKMTSYLSNGVKAKMCETTPYVNSVGTQYIASRAQIEQACDSLRQQGRSKQFAVGLTKGDLCPPTTLAEPATRAIVEALVIPPDAIWSTLMMYTKPFPPDLLQHTKPCHEVLLSCQPHRPGCHYWKSMQYQVHDEIEELQPDVIVERYLDAKYYQYSPEQFDDMSDYNLHASYLAESDQVITLQSMETDEITMSTSLRDNMQELMHTVPEWESDTQTINPKWIEHHQSGHLTKDPTCPVCMEEAGSKINHRRKNADRHPGIMHCDLAAFEASADGHKYCLVAAVTIEVDSVSKLLPFFIPMPKKDALCATNALKEALLMCDNRNLHQIKGSRVTRIQADGGGEFTNKQVRDLCWEKNIVLSYSPAHQPSSNGIAERMVGMLKTTVRRMLKQADLGREWWSYACRFAGHMMRERVLGRDWTYPLFGQLVGIWRSHDKAQAKSLDDRGSVGYLLDIDIWQSGTTRILQDGVVIKGLAPRRLDPSRYQLTASPSRDTPETNMPWRSIQDELGRFKWLDHQGKIYSGVPYSVEPDVNAKQMFIASMMHTSSQSPVLKDVPDVTCPSDLPAAQKRREVVQFDNPTAGNDRRPKRAQPSDGKPNLVIKAKSIPVSPKTVASSTGAMREKWLRSIYKEIENFLQNMAIDDADPALIVAWREKGKWPLPCQMVFVLKPLTQSQQEENDVHEEYKHKSRLVICGNFATWGEHSTTTTNLDAPLLRLMLSLACSKETTWSSVDITSAFLNADIHEDDTVLITPPPILVKMDIVKPNTVWRVKKAIYGLREAPRLWQQERDQKLQDIQFVYNDRSVHLVQSYIHPSLWFIAEGPKTSTKGIPPFDNKLRSDEWTAQLHQHKILGYVGVYVDDLLIAGPRTLNETLIKAVQGIWKTSTPEHLGPDSDCVPILRFLGMNLERVDAARSKELDMPEGSILLNQMEYILEVLLKFEPSLQLKTRTTPGNQESFSPSSFTSHDQNIAEYLDSLQMLIAEDIIEAEAAAKPNPRLHYNSDQVVINLPAIVGCLNWIALRSRPDIAWATSRAASLITHDADLCFVRVKHICQYLQYTLSYALRYVPIPPTSKQKLWVLGDASFAPTGEKSQQGIVVYHGITSNSRKGGNLVQWRSSRQDLVAKSTCEAELIAASEALQQGENISIIIAEMTNACCEIEVSSDNAAALHMVRNGSETAWRTRHISVKALWLHQMSRRGIRFSYQSTSDMAADSLTKGLGASRLPRIMEDLCLIDD